VRIVNKLNMNPDVAIVGAGPIGLVSARAAAEAGAQTLVVERKPEGSAPSCCTGLVSPRTLSTLGVTNECLLREIHALRVHLPSSRQIDLKSDQLKAVTIDRRALEQELLDKARQAGAVIRFNAEAVDASVGTLHIQSDADNLQLHPSIIVGADGPRSRVASWFSLEQPSQFAPAAQVELDDVSFPSDRVNVFLGCDVAPGFFGWSVPAEEGILRVGLGVLPPHDPIACLDRLLAEHYPTARIRSRTAGCIPLASTLEPAAPGVLLVGDAAGHVKPLSGGGLYTGGLCAELAGTTAARIANRGAGSEDSSDLLASYTSHCLEAIGKEQAFGRSMRIHFSRLSDKDVEAVAVALDDRHLLQFLADEADIDFFHQLPDRLASEPSLWSTLLRIVPLLGSLTD
jgi:digeranylgeranylglycerophospholipid reductase